MHEYSKAGDMRSLPSVRVLPLRYLDGSVHARDPYFDGAAALDQGPAVAAFRAVGEDASAAQPPRSGPSLLWVNSPAQAISERPSTESWIGRPVAAVAAAASASVVVDGRIRQSAVA